MKENGLPKNYDMEDLSFEDFPTPAIMQVAIWIQQKEFKKKYPECVIEIIHYQGFIRIIAHEPDKKEIGVV